MAGSKKERVPQDSRKSAAGIQTKKYRNNAGAQNAAALNTNLLKLITDGGQVPEETRAQAHKPEEKVSFDLSNVEWKKEEKKDFKKNLAAKKTETNEPKTQKAHSPTAQSIKTVASAVASTARSAATSTVTSTFTSAGKYRPKSHEHETYFKKPKIRKAHSANVVESTKTLTSATTSAVISEVCQSRRARRKLSSKLHQRDKKTETWKAHSTVPSTVTPTVTPTITQTITKTNISDPRPLLAAATCTRSIFFHENKSYARLPGSQECELYPVYVPVPETSSLPICFSGPALGYTHLYTQTIEQPQEIPIPTHPKMKDHDSSKISSAPPIHIPYYCFPNNKITKD